METARTCISTERCTYLLDPSIETQETQRSYLQPITAYEGCHIEVGIRFTMVPRLEVVSQKLGLKRTCLTGLRAWSGQNSPWKSWRSFELS